MRKTFPSSFFPSPPLPPSRVSSNILYRNVLASVCSLTRQSPGMKEIPNAQHTPEASRRHDDKPTNSTPTYLTSPTLPIYPPPKPPHRPKRIEKEKKKKRKNKKCDIENRPHPSPPSRSVSHLVLTSPKAGGGGHPAPTTLHPHPFFRPPPVTKCTF